ncbi:MAG: hypothetical protein COB33_007475 [Thiotrichaceae bacterium]|nr:hypothetical protein [Thiotrichaceae bacterium]
MNMKHFLAGLAFTVAAGAAWAGDDKSFSELDTNSSGTIDRTEAAVVPALSEQWVVLDINMDGKLEEAEFAKFETESGD